MQPNCQRILLIVPLIFLSLFGHCLAQSRTYCNPLNLDYAYCAIPNFMEQGKHRTAADPVIVLFKGNYFLFATNQYGYWWSSDLSLWQFIPRRFLKPFHQVYDELCAPAAVAIDDTLLLIGSTYTKDFPLWMSTNPTQDNWVEAVDSFQVGAWDPAFFLDDDQRLYLYFGSSNVYPIYGQEIDRRTWQPIGKPRELLHLQDDIHGWERFGEHADNTFLRPFIEGAWMNKYHGRYYLQYAAPGTEFSGYADGVYISESPLGPFRYQAHNPFSYKPGGFARGAGHGATFQDKFGNWWHVATIAISVKNNFERRIGLWPAGFDPDGVLYCNTAYGDFPHYLPDERLPQLAGRFTGWMLLNYNKPVTASSILGGYGPNFAVDEDIRTYWSAATGNAGEWLQSDLGAIATIYAIQINYADQNAELMGKQTAAFHQYAIFGSVDSKKWQLLVDKRNNQTDVPHDYVELRAPAKFRFLKIENKHVPTGKFALSGFRAFGKGNGAQPDTVKNFMVLRGESEPRNAWLKWCSSDEAVGYTIYFGIAPDKLYNSITVYGHNEFWLTGMEKGRTYYFQIEAFNENGIGRRTRVTQAI
ncbi:MAG: family 43 glycosylhydrolase [candidate division KSB1 bacterium]|nr:family 43 glycosylhydrolase [candidate division KSB1 bacterium]